MSTPTITREDFDEYSLIKDADCDQVVEKDVMQGPCRITDIHAVIGAAIAYVKLYDDRNPTLGTTVPKYIIRLTTSFNGPIMLPGKVLSFASGLSWACVAEAGTAGTTAPSQTVALTVTCKEGL